MYATNELRTDSPSVTTEEQESFFSPGTIINDTYRIEQFIAAGSMGQVFLCSHVHLEGAKFALKVLRLSGRDVDTIDFIRFKKEIEISLQLTHPNVVSSYAFIQHDDYIAFVMEYVPGGDLAEYLRDQPQVPVDEVLRILTQVCSGLEAIHEKGVTHRDVKPENILLAENGDVRITDFGIARFKGSNNLTAYGSILGTMEYLSPEYLQEGKCDKRSDIYALGLIGYEMITGTQPFTGNTLLEALQKKMNSELVSAGEIRPDCPEVLSDIFRKALEPNPDLRYQTAAEMLSDLQQVIRFLENGGASRESSSKRSIFSFREAPPVELERMFSSSQINPTKQSVSAEEEDADSSCEQEPDNGGEPVVETIELVEVIEEGEALIVSSDEEQGKEAKEDEETEELQGEESERHSMLVELLAEAEQDIEALESGTYKGPKWLRPVTRFGEFRMFTLFIIFWWVLITRCVF